MEHYIDQTLLIIVEEICRAFVEDFQNIQEYCPYKRIHSRGKVAVNGSLKWLNIREENAKQIKVIHLVN